MAKNKQKGGDEEAVASNEETNADAIIEEFDILGQLDSDTIGPGQDPNILISTTVEKPTAQKETTKIQKVIDELKDQKQKKGLKSVPFYEQLNEKHKKVKLNLMNLLK